MPTPSEAILLHRDGFVISVDDETAAMFGYLATEMIGMPLADVLDEKATLTSEGAEPCAHQAIGVRKDGSRFMLDMMDGCSCGAKRTNPTDYPARILIVEDDPETLQTMTRLLTMKGYQVHGAPDMKTALKMAHQAEFDLLLSDICLPDGTGWDLLTQLRGAARPIRAIAMSALDGQEDFQRSQTAGFAEHLVKPVRMEKLDRALRCTLGPPAA